ncbi:EamA family transporter [Tepidamorphus sp. 3E244]|uniref:EamA family transporter n=1 Tax=Tepidamorphus sp. 3E244 TaxID=3385498 RepID=UPI0038FD3300
MTPLGFALVFAAAICHATWNFLVKRIAAGPELIWLFSTLTLVIYAPLALWIFFSERPDLGLVHLVFIAGSAVLHLGYFLLLQTGYRHGDLSLIYPTARATGPLLSAGFAAAFLGENLMPQMGSGAAIIIAGVFMLTGGASKGRLLALAPSHLFGIATGCFIGTYTVWDAHAVAALAIPPLILDYASSIGRSVLLAPTAWRRREAVARLWQDHRASVIAMAIFNPLAYILVLYALTFTPVIYVAPLRETSVLLSVLAGSLLLGEGHLRRRLSWGVVILAGVAILSTG